MPITALAAAILAPIFIALSIRVIGARRTARVAVGDNDDPILIRRMRVQANFAEYVPFSLVLIGFAESLPTPRSAIWLLAALLVIGRAAHAYGMSQPRENFAFRVTGMVCTFTVLAGGALACLLGFLSK